MFARASNSPKLTCLFTKTLAKIAVETAKKLPITHGVVYWDHAAESYWTRPMVASPVTEV